MWRPGALWCTRALLGAPRLGLGAPRCSQVGPEGLNLGCFQKGDFGGILVGATRWGLCAPKCSGLCGSTLVGCSQVLRPCGSTRDLGCSQKGAPRAAPRKGHQNEPTNYMTLNYGFCWGQLEALVAIRRYSARSYVRGVP